MEGTTLGKYQIRSTIGRGAVGIVYEGWDPTLARKVAVKTLPLLGTDEEGREKHARFLQEARAVASLYHPNIVGIYDYGETDSLAYIVMELILGRPMDALLEKGARLPLGEVARIMDGLLAGLQHSHERGVVHRDIKPGNVVVTADGTVKITDFGIAHLESSEMTRLGSVMGTPAYMAPEQVLGEPVDARTDLYSAGVVLYQMLLGRRPFEGGTASIMHKIVNAEPVLPDTLLDSGPPGIAEVLAKALAKRAEDRFPSAREFARTLREVFGRAGVPSAEPAEDATIVASSGTLSVATRTGTGTATAAATASRGAGASLAPAAAPGEGPAKQQATREGRRSSVPAVLAAIACAALLGGGWWAFRLPDPAAEPGAAAPALAASSQAGQATVSQTSQAARPGRSDDAVSTSVPPPPAPLQSAAIQPASSQPASSQPASSQPASPQPAALPPAVPSMRLASNPSAAAPSAPPFNAPPAPAPAAPSGPPAGPPGLLSTAPPSSIPAAPPGPLPVVPPSPSPAMLPPAPPASAADTLALAIPPLEAALNEAAATLPCALVRAVPDHDGLAVNGLTALGAASGMQIQGVLRRVVAKAAPAPPVAWNIRQVEEPYCGVLDALRLARAGASGLAQGAAGLARATAPSSPLLSLADPAAKPAEGAAIRINVAAPAGGFVLLDFYAADRSVTHLPLAAARNGSVTVPAPHGVGLVTLLAAPAALVEPGRPGREEAAAYLEDLRTGLARVHGAGKGVAVEMLVVEGRAQ